MKRKTVRGIGENLAKLQELASIRDGWVRTFERIISGKAASIEASVCAEVEEEPEVEDGGAIYLDYSSAYQSMLYGHLTGKTIKAAKDSAPDYRIQERIAVHICVTVIQNIDADIAALMGRNDALNGLAASAEEMYKAYENKRNGETR